MDTKKWKRKKYRWAAAWILIALILIAISGTFAAYTSFNSVKRVVSTGRRSDTLFGSNYLSLVNLGDTVYTSKHISPTEVKNSSGNITAYTFTVQVCNYAYGNTAVYNTKEIKYTLEVNLTPRAGDSLPDNVSNIFIKVNDNDSNKTSFQSGLTVTLNDQTLSGNAANMNIYTFNIPDDLKDKVKFEIIAVPSGDNSQNSVNNQKLAGVITLSSLTPTEDWTGKFIDSKYYSPNAYDAFNYEISGNGAGTVTLTWDTRLQISKWFTGNNRITGNSYTFSVGENTMAYQLQFYRNPDTPFTFSGNDISAHWSSMEGWVTVTFESGSASASS